MPTITLNAYLVVVQPVVTSPNQIILPAGPLTDAVKSVVMIRNDGTNSLVLSEPGVNAPGADVSVVETVIGRMFTLSVNFPAGLQIKPDEKFEVTVKSNHPKFPLIRVPVIQAQPHTATVSGTNRLSPHSLVPANRAVPVAVKK
jgi:hypothetical protein